MKIGMTLYSSNPIYPLALESIRHVAKSLTDALTSRHELVFLSPRYGWAPDEEVQAMTEDFVRASDAVVLSAAGWIPAARRRMGSNVPIVGFMLGVFSRGGWGMHDQYPYLTTNDVLVLNCTSDMELANRFFHNARTRLLPFAIDDNEFYPLDAEQRRAAREKHGFREDDRILVYAGRVTLQKNIQTLLKVFAAVQEVVPHACLLIVGPMLDQGSPEFGIVPLHLGRTLEALVAGLGIPEGRVRFMSQGPPSQVRELYNIADIKVNLTLHHDENFGLSQVEAMACGTPVVGTAWGGLKDTIAEGVSGYKVSTSMTPLGVKASWWEAVNRIVTLLRDPAARERFRESCVRYARDRYSQSRYEATLLETIDGAVAGREEPAEPLRPTEFAQELWSTCNPGTSDAPSFLRGPRSFALYQELIGPITGTAAEDVPPGEPLDPRRVLSLASPVVDDREGRYRVDDPMYPFEFEVPDAHGEAFAAILSVVREEPAITVERLSRSLEGRGDAADTLTWMLERGLLLRTRPVDGWLSPETIDGRLAQPFFRMERVDRAGFDVQMY